MRLALRHRWLGALITLTYAVGYLLVFAHYAGERHAKCLEHGTQHHVEHHDEPGAEPPAGISAFEPGDDDHCELASVIRNTSIKLASTVVDQPPTVATSHRCGLLPATDDRPRGDVWRYAPKTSPPSPV